MAAPRAPIIVLRQDDDAVSAFFTTVEAVYHLSREHGFQDLADMDCFDARGRRLDPAIGPDGSLRDFAVASDENYVEHIRERVRRRSRHARQVLELEWDRFERVDESPLTLADEDIDFEVFAWRLASVLRPEGSPSDPVPKGPVLRHSAGWWHNTFGH